MVRKLTNLIIQRKYEIGLALAVSTIGAWLLRLTLMRHWSFSSYHFDLGNMHQTVFNSSQGRFLEFTDPYTFDNVSRLRFHFDPILALISPMYLVYPHAEVLIVTQVLAFVLSAILIYLLALSITRSKPYSLLWSVLFLLYYPAHNALFADFHPVVLVMPFLFLMIYGARVKKYWLMWIAVLLAWTTKENVFLATGFFGGYLLFFSENMKSRIQGLALGSISLVGFLTVMMVIIPSFRPADVHFAAGYYTSDLKTNLERFLSMRSFQYIRSLLRPVGFMPLFAPLILFIPFSEWAINILSKNQFMTGVSYHYTAVLIPFIFWSAIEGFWKMHQWVAVFIQPSHIKIVRGFMTLSVILLSVLAFYSNSPLRKAKYTINTQEQAYVAELQERFADSDIRLSTTGHLSPHFAARRYFYNFFFDFAYQQQGYSEEYMKSVADHYSKADYVIVKESELNENELVQYYYKTLKNDSRFDMIEKKAGIELYKKK